MDEPKSRHSFRDMATGLRRIVRPQPTTQDDSDQPTPGRLSRWLAAEEPGLDRAEETYVKIIDEVAGSE
jgi:hypothetical protein